MASQDINNNEKQKLQIFPLTIQLFYVKVFYLTIKHYFDIKLIKLLIIQV
jgi:hypothetical protein